MHNNTHALPSCSHSRLSPFTATKTPQLRSPHSNGNDTNPNSNKNPAAYPVSTHSQSNLRSPSFSRRHSPLLSRLCASSFSRRHSPSLSALYSLILAGSFLPHSLGSDHPHSRWLHSPSLSRFRSASISPSISRSQFHHSLSQHNRINGAC